MGDIADDLYDRMMDDLDGSDDYDSYERMVDPRAPTTATCSRCGQGNLKWRLEDGRWCLYELERDKNNRMPKHDCRLAAADDFEVLA